MQETSYFMYKLSTLYYLEICGFYEHHHRQHEHNQNMMMLVSVVWCGL